MAPSAPQRLGPGDWVRGALDTLAEGGVDAVRVEPLAARLGVTRGSFYWHFADRNALLEAMIDTWEARETEGVIASIEAGGGSPRQRLARLVDYCVADDGRLETELRVWGLRDAAVARRLGEVDARRVDYLAALFGEAGSPAAEARLRAGHLYKWWVGQFLLRTGAQHDERQAAARHFLGAMLDRNL